MKHQEFNDVFIGGRFEPAHTLDRITLTDPATENSFATIPDGDAHDVDRALAAAQEALSSWRMAPPSERAGSH